MKLLVTGSSGLLGTELKKCLEGNVIWTDKENLDIMDNKEIWEILEKYNYPTILHLAAYTDVAKAEFDKKPCWDLNVIGTKNIAKATKYNGGMIYISTDYVFDGEKGYYTPEDIPNPVNFYAMTKLIGEQIVLSMNPLNLVIRTSFKPCVWKHPKACVDMWTSADYVDVIAHMIAKCVMDTSFRRGIVHIGTERKSIYNLASRRNTVEKMSRHDISTHLPKDVSFGSSN